MSVPQLHETQVEELDLPGRHLRWVVGDGGSDRAALLLLRDSRGSG